MTWDAGYDWESETFGKMATLLLPLVISALGIIFSLIATKFIKVSDDGKEAEVQSALNKGNWGSIIMTAIACYFLIDWMLPDMLSMNFFKGETTGEDIITTFRFYQRILRCSCRTWCRRWN